MAPPQADEDEQTGCGGTELEQLREEVQRLREELRSRSAGADSSQSAASQSSAARTTAPRTTAQGSPRFDSDGFFREVLDSFPEQVAVFDRDLRFVYVNRASAESAAIREWMIGHTDEEYCRKLDRSDDFVSRRQRWQQRAIETRASVSFEEEVEVGAEEFRHFLRIFNPVFAEAEAGSELLWLLGYGVEITENRLLQEQLRQAQKLEAVGQLVSGVAHDFNNLLTALQGYSDLLLRALAPDTRQAMLASEIRKVGDKASSLTRQLLTYSRRRRRKPDDLDINEAVRDSSMLLERTLGGKIDVKIDLVDGPLGVSIDAGQLQQVLLNLALNARDAMENGGLLRLGTGREPWVEREGQRLKGPWAVLRVEDEGTGITEALREKIFEPFFTTKAEDKGTGLGLSTVSGIARQNGGHIRLHTEVGKGSRFEVVFPELSLSEKRSKAETGAPAELEGDGMETLLLVEDEDSVRELTAGFLRHLGYTVLEARDGLEALAISEQFAGRLDLVLSDVVMPRMGGPELARQLSPRRPQARWVFMSGFPDRARMPGVVGAKAPFLEKPFRPSQLGRTIRKVLDRPLG